MNGLNYRSTTILYVDDEKMACKYFASAVGSDYEVLTALSADAAIAIIAAPENRVGVLVTDYRMPGRDGGDLLRQIEREYPHIVRILVTAYVDKSVLLETVNSGEIFQILEKPLGLMEIRRVLRLASALARERSAKQQKLLAIDETLVFLAQELNTPLAAIMEFSKEISHGGNTQTPEPQQQQGQQHLGKGSAAALIHANASYCVSVLSTFCNSIHNASTVSPNNGVVSSTACQLIESLLDTYPLSSTERGWIQTDIREDFAVVFLPNCIALVLSSLLRSALHALHGCAVPLLCFTVLVDEHPQIRISDNGPGIPREILDRLLLDPIMTHMQTDVTGWSFIFCKRVMESFGGDISIASEPGKGATVVLNFPKTKEKASRGSD